MIRNNIIRTDRPSYLNENDILTRTLSGGVPTTLGLYYSGEVYA